MYKRQIYQIAESNRIESKLFLPELECSTADERCQIIHSSCIQYVACKVADIHRCLHAAGTKAQQYAGSVNAVVRRGSTRLVLLLSMKCAADCAISNMQSKWVAR